jgi:toxin ParE1/3/4
MATYKLSPDAEDDLYRIWVYGSKKFGIAQADKYYKAFFHQFDLIAKDPFLYPTVDHIRKDYRRAV